MGGPGAVEKHEKGQNARGLCVFILDSGEDQGLRAAERGDLK